MSNSTQLGLAPPRGLDERVTRAIEKWLNERHADELHRAQQAWQGRRVELLQGDWQYAGWTGQVTGLRLRLGQDALFEAVVRLDRNGEEVVVAPTQLRGTTTSETEARAEQQKQDDLKQKLQDKHAEALSLVNRFVRVRDGRRLGYYLATGLVVAHDTQGDQLSVKMCLDGRTIHGFRSGELLVVV